MTLGARRVVRQPVSWDVMREHLAEAAFLWGHWERALVSPRYTLAEVAAGPEERLRAHIDGLVVGGAEVAERLLVPALVPVNDEAEPVFAAAAALLAGGDPERTANLIGATRTADAAALSAIGRAFALHPSRETTAALLAAAEADAGLPPAAEAIVLDACRRTAVDPGAVLDRAMRGEDASAKAVALEIARRAGRFTPELLGYFLKRRHRVAGEAALHSARRAGLAPAWNVALERAEGPEPSRDDLVCLAVAGEPERLELLFTLAGIAQHRRDALWALGYAGRVRGAEICLDLMADESCARLAGDAFSAITGLALAGELVATGAGEDEDEDEAEAEEDDEDGGLPRPARAAVARWWSEQRSRFTVDTRYMAGTPATVERAIEVLASGPMHRRPALALELCARTAGEVDVDVADWAHRQQRALAAARVGRPVRFDGAIGGGA
jgi:uncharacterized protein (TIGR02270 family)